LDSSEHEPSYYEVALTNRQVVIGFVALLACVLTAFLAGVWLGRDAAPSAEAQLAEATPPPAKGKRDKRLEKLTFFGEDDGSVTTEPVRPAGARGRRDGAADHKPGDAPKRKGADASKREAAAAPMPAASDAASETMRRTLEAEMAANRETPPAAVVSAPETEPPATADPMPATPGERVRRSPATAPKPPPPSRGPAATTAPAVAAPKPAPTATKPAAAPVAATTTPAKPAPSAAPVAAPFWIQVYSSSNSVRAREISAQLGKIGFGVRVLESGTSFRVRVGPYATRDAADAAARQLRREHKLDTWVTDQP